MLRLASQIRISASRVNQTLELKVQDDGPGVSPENSSQGRGIGLANTRTRLHQLYGDGAKLTGENSERGGAIVTMLLPYHLAPESSGREVVEVHALHNADR